MFRLFLGFLLLATPAFAQRDVIVQRGGPYNLVPGPAAGSLLVGTSKGFYYSATGQAPFHRPNKAEYPGPANLNLTNRHYWYDVLPSGRVVTRDFATGNLLCLAQRGVIHPVPVAPMLKPKSEAPYDIEYFYFTDETTALLYQYNQMGIYQTRDQGRSWHYLSSLASSVEAPYRGYIRHFYMLSPELGFAVVQVHHPGEDRDPGANPFKESRLLRTTDGGRTWARVQMPAGFTRERILGVPHYVRQGERVYLLCYGDDQLFVSQDEGASFAAQVVPSMEHLSAHFPMRGKQMAVDEKTYAPFRLVFYDL